MSTDKSAGFNLYDAVAKVRPYMKIIFKRWYIPAAVAVLLGINGFWQEKNKDSQYSAQLTYMLEDEVLGQNSSPNTNPLMAAITGQSPTSNKAIMNDLAWSNKLIEATLLRKGTFQGKEVLLANYYQQCLQYLDLKNTGDPYFFKDNYTIGTDEKLDFRLRSLSNMIKLSFKPTTMESGLLKLTFTSNNELFTRIFLEEHLKTVSDFYISKRLERAMSLVNMTKRKKDSLLALLQGKEFGMAAVQDQGFGTVMKRAVVPEMQLKRDIGIIGGQYAESMAALSAARLELERKKPFISVVDDIRFPLEAVHPSPVSKGIINAILGLILGALLPAGFAVARDFIKKQKLAYKLQQSDPF